MKYEPRYPLCRRSSDRVLLFSLVELLIVVAILAVLSSLLAPGLNNMLYKASVKKCGFNFKNIGIATMLYTEDNDENYIMYTDFSESDYRSNGRTSNNSVDHLGRSEILQSMMIPYVGGTKESYWETYICPQVDDEGLWPTTHASSHPPGIRAPAYYTQRMPIVQFFTIYGFRGRPTIMRRVGDTWNWGNSPDSTAGENGWSQGPSDAIHYEYNLLAGDRIMKVGSWGRWTTANHKPPGFPGVNYERGWSAKELSAAYDYEANYLSDDGSVKFYKGIEHTPGEGSDFLKFHRGTWVPVEAGNPQ
jgi:prepilin-type N-terminal cleavage/methylation domain-containing protein